MMRSLVLAFSLCLLASSLCTMAPFPDSLKYFLFQDSLDITDDYSFNTNQTSNIRSALSVKDESFFRMSAAPLVSDYMVLVSVYNQDGTQIILYPETRFQKSHGLTYGHLQAGEYLVQFSFTKTSSSSSKPTDPSCIPVRVAVGLRSVAEVADHASRFKDCPAKSTIPEVDFSNLALFMNVDYDSDDFPDKSFAIVPTDSSLVSVGDERYAGKLIFTIPEGYRASFQAAINLDFTASGYVSVVLQSGIQSENPEPPQDLGVCVSSGDCEVSVAQTLGGKAATKTLIAGTYALWFMFSQGNVPSPEQQYSPCAPYGLNLRIQLKNSGSADEDNFVKCNSLKLPERLDVSEADSTLFIQYGLFYFNRRVLLEAAVPQHKTAFKITKESLFRLRIDPHTADLDVYIHDSNGNIVAHAARVKGEEHLAVRLAPDDYTATFITFGSHSAIDCEFYELEISIEPAEMTFSDFCTSTGKDTELPDLTQLADLSKTIQEFHFEEPFKTFNYVFPTGATIAQVELVRQNFTLSQNTRVVAHLLSDFLRSDITFHIENRQNPSAPHIDPTHDKNSYDMLEILPPGEYAFVIETGLVQEENVPKATEFLPCAPFRLNLAMVPPDRLSEADNLCGATNFFPRSVSYPGLLATTDVLHAAKFYRAPTVNHSHVMETSYTEIKTRVRSLLRVTVPRIHLDIDLRLRDTEGNVLATSEHTAQDEDISYILEANTDYVLATTFYHFNNSVHYDAPCYLYFIDFSLTPDTISPSSCTEQRLPPNNLIPTTIPDEGFFHEETYQFVRNNQKEIPSTYIAFTLEKEASFRATVQSDNIFSPLDMTLLLDSSVSGTEYDGVHNYNIIDVGTVTLPPGSYILIISAPRPPNGAPPPMNEACLEFYFRVGVINSVYDSSKPLPVVTSYSSTLPICDNLLPAPLTLNAPGFLHVIDGSSLYLGNPRLVDKTTHRDLIDLRLDEDSIVKAFIPSQTHVDVDVAILRGTRAQPGDVVLQTSGSGDEGFSARLSAGNYVVELMYYAWSSDKCTPYVAQIAVMPISEVQKRPDLTTECQPNYPEKTAVLDKEFSGSYNWNPSRSQGLPVNGNAYNTTIEFDIAEGKVGTIEVELAAEFISGGLAMRLEEKINMNLLEIERNVTASYSTHRAFISEILWPGHYILHLEDTSSAKAEAVDGPSDIKCASYRLTYTIVSDAKVDPGTCIHVEMLPTNLNDTSGGCVPYGGPQLPDGTVYVHGEHFYLSNAEGVNDQWTSFSVPSEGIAARIAVQIPEAGLTGSDIDVYVYENRSDMSSLVATLMGTDAFDSGLFFLTPKNGQNSMFSLRSFAYNVDTGERCVYFRWSVGLMSKLQARENLRCPAIVPSPGEAMPPSTIVVGDEESKEVTSDSYMITHDVFMQYTKNGVFEYPITIDAQDNVTFGVSVRYNFVINDFRIQLKNAETGRVYLSAIPGDAGYSHGYFNRVVTFPHMPLLQGKYILSIIDDVSRENITKYAPYGQTGAFCEKFAFSLTAKKGRRAPRTSLTSIEPSSIDDFEPCDDIRITLGFNDRVSNVPSSSAELVSFLTEQNVVKLAPVADPSAAGPCLDGALLGSDLRSIQMLFSKADFSFGASYKLVLDVTKLKNATGDPFTDAAEGTRIYKITDCNCSGHGKCKSPGPSGECVYCECEGLWAGTNCEGCKDGYHYVEGYGCVGDEVCDETSCSGHGTCDNSTGIRKCLCDPGYASSEEGECDMCAWGYEGYPQCVKQKSYDSSSCKALILPETLDTPQYSGWDMHPILSGEFWADLTSMTDEFEFSTTEDVLFRAHTANENVDVDMWLFKLNPDGTVGDSVASGTSISDTETIFVKLTGGTKEVPVKYLLRFNYYVSSASWSMLTDCETFQFELEMQSYSKVKAGLENWNKKCPKEDVLPEIPTHNITTNFTYDTAGKTFAIHRPAGVPVSPHFFWSHNFTVASVQDHMPLLRAFVGSRFLFGQVNFVLERLDGRKPADYCVTELNFKDRCARGDNTLNGNYIERVIEPGRYTLWLYEPILQDDSYVNCAQFDFAFSVTYVDSSTEFWECDAPELPIDLNKAHYMHDDGSMHFRDVFHTAGVRSTGFSVKSESVFRIGSNGGIKFTLTRTSDMKVLFHGATDIFTVLSAGYYTLAMHSPLSSHPRCLMLDFEVALFPFDLIKAGTPSCTSSSLPDLAGVGVPYSFPNDSLTFCATPYASQNTEVARYPIYISETAVFFAALSSDFAVHDLRMVLINTTSGNTISTSKHNFNHHFIQERLPAGQYSLILEVPSVTDRDSRLPNTIPFNFDLQIRRYNASSAISVCLLDGHELPASFNNERFLAAASSGAGSLTFADFEVRVPAGIIVTAQREIPMTFTAETTLFRTYIEPNNAIDVDVFVMQKGNDVPVASGIGGIGTEEVITTLLPKGEYFLRLVYWVWDKSSLPLCPKFKMQVMATPQLSPSKCADGDKWPEGIPSEITSNYRYSSREQYVDLHFEQTDRMRMFAIPFKLKREMNFYSTIAYDLRDTQVALRLDRYSPDGNRTMVYYGEPSYGRSTINLRQLPVGDYILDIYEGLRTPEAARTCAHYAFDFAVQEPSTLWTNEHSSLPTSLDGIPYLGYDKTLDIFDTFMLFRFSNMEDTFFTLDEDSYVRVSAEFEEVGTAVVRPLAEDIEIEIAEAASGSKVVAKYMTHMHVRLSKGKYRLSFKKKAEAQSINGEGIETQIAIHVQSVKSAQEDVTNAGEAGKATCIDTLVPSIEVSPDGFYQYDGYKHQVCEETLKQQTIQQLSLDLTQESVVWIRVGFEFAFSHVDLLVTLEDGTFMRSLLSRNAHGFRGILPAGHHKVSLSSPGHFPHNHDELPRCTPFSFSIVVSPDDEKSRCAYLDTVPWNLNRYDGGSLRFGGPIDPETGVLELYGDEFGVPTGHYSDTMDIDIVNDSLVSIFLSASSQMSTVSARLVQSGTGKEISPIGFQESNGQRQFLSTWKVEPHLTGKKEYKIILEYNGLYGSCGAFAMQLSVQPMEMVQADIMCDEYSGKTPDYPEHNIIIDGEGFAQDLHDTFTITNDSLNSGRAYDINFTAKESETVSLSISYSAFVNLYDVALYLREPTGRLVQITSGTLRPQRQMAGDTTITRVVYATVVAGDYVFRVRQNNWSFKFPFDLTVRPPMCLPFLYTAQIFPNNGIPYVADVSPASARNLDPKANVNLFLQFSEAIYDKRSNALAAPAAIAESFTLVGEGETSRIDKSKITVRKLASDSSAWSLSFNGTGVFEPSKIFKLNFTSDFLVDSDSKQTRYVLINRYAMIDTACSGHGTLKGSVCYCEEEYGGVSCDRCNLGYTRVEGVEPGTFRCIPAVKCEVDTCGCRYDSNGTCTPLGNCTIDQQSGRAVCTCNEGFDGAYCRTCKATYVSWPVCVHCLHNGKWSESSKKCSCPVGFTGKNCEKCGFGRSGPNCTVSSNVVVISIAIVVGVIVAVLIIIAVHFHKKDKLKPVKYAPVNQFDEDDDGESYDTVFGGDLSKNASVNAGGFSYASGDAPEEAPSGASGDGGDTDDDEEAAKREEHASDLRIEAAFADEEKVQEKPKDDPFL